MASLTLRTLTRPGDHTKNAPLTNAEVDTNFINLDADLDLKAPIDSPTFTGVPTAPTAAAGTSTTQLATTEFVTSAINPISALVTSLSNAIDTTDNTVTFDVTGAIELPAGTDAQRPATPADGALRYNTTSNTFEGYSNGAWHSIPSGATGTQYFFASF